MLTHVQPEEEEEGDGDDDYRFRPATIDSRNDFGKPGNDQDVEGSKNQLWFAVCCHSWNTLSKQFFQPEQDAHIS